MEPNLTELSETQLQDVIENARRALRGKQESRRKEVFAEIRKLAASVGVVVEISEADKVTTTSRPTRTSKVAAKYRNPANPSQTWTGRGMKPVWLRDFLNSGRNINDFLIK